MKKIFKAIVLGSIAGFFIFWIFSGLLYSEVPYTDDGRCDVCGAPATHIIERKFGLPFGTVNEFCLPHSVIWAMNNNFGDGPTELCIAALIPLFILVIICILIINKLLA